MSLLARTTTNPLVVAPAVAPAAKHLLQRKCACGSAPEISGDCEECGKKRLQRQGGATPVPQSTAVIDEVLRSPGQPLDAEARKYFELRLGHDFSRVRIHPDARASRSAAAINALAYTSGPHIVFQAGHYDVNSTKGRRLMAHELVHVIQQGQIQPPAQNGLTPASSAEPGNTGIASSHFEISTPGDQLEHEADTTADRVVAQTTIANGRLHDKSQDKPQVSKATQTSLAQRSLLQRQPTGQQPAACPTGVTLSTGADDVHVPLCGIANVTANTVPPNIPGIQWTLVPRTAQIAAGTSINAGGVITFGAAQGGGTLDVTAIQPATATATSCDAFEQLRLHSHPTTITNTFVVGPPAAGAAALYGAVFDHNFASADGNTASLQFVKVGEQFSGVPNPTAASHTIPNTPFGPFRLSTRTLTPNGTNTWSMDNGNLGGRHDTVTIERSIVNVGNFVRSASNPTPAAALPATFTLTQSLFWFCRQAAAGSRWTRFIDVDHVRTLRLNGSAVEFVVTVNGFDNVQDYTGHPAIINARANPATIPPTPRPTRRGPPPTPSTTTVSADTLPDPLPARHRLRFSIRGNPLGSRIDNSSGVFTAGPTVGTVTVRISDSVRNPNFDETVVTIANPTPQPAQPQPGQQPGQQPTQPQPVQPGQSPQGQQSGLAPDARPALANAETTPGSSDLERSEEE